jgi:hypothetical protein
MTLLCAVIRVRRPVSLRNAAVFRYGALFSDPKALASAGAEWTARAL